nr:ATP-grasp domain-containing protein [Neobacillus sp. Marseille-Q6967]
MESIVFLGTNKTGSSYEGIRAAKRLGYHTVLFTNRSLFWEKKHEYPEINEVRLINMSDKEDIFLEVDNLIAEGRKISCFISFLDEYIYMAAMLTSTLCNPSLTFEALKFMADKLAVRRLLAHKSYTPFFTELSSIEMLYEKGRELKHLFPLILKTPKSNGSKDVLYVNSISEFNNGIKRLYRKHPEQFILIEEYLEGPQYLVEVVVYDKKVTIPAIVEQEVQRMDRFIITGYSLSPTLKMEELSGLKETVESIIADINLEYGTCHLELKLTNKGWKLIEINPRMAGGAMNRIIEEAFGYNLAEQTLQLYLGKEPLFIRSKEKCIYAHYIIGETIGILLKITGSDLAKKHSGIIEVFTKTKNGQIITPPRSMGHRYGYILAAADTKDQAKELAIQAAGQISFYLQPI